MNLRYRYLVATAIALSLVAGFVVTQVGALPADQVSAATSGAEALRATVDKETGQLRAATAKETAELRKLEQKAKRDLNKDYLKAAGVPEFHADGKVSIVVDFANLETVKATVSSDGSVILRHGEHEIPAAINAWPEE